MTFAQLLGLIGVRLPGAKGTGPMLSRAQWILCAVCFDGAQPDDFKGRDRDTFRELFGDVDRVTPEQRATVAWVKGARIGGTWLAALRMLHLALTADLSTLAAGENGFVALVGPDTRLPGQAIRYVEGALRSHPTLATAITASAVESLTIRRGDGRHVTFEILPASAGGRALRGRSLVAAVMTEAAFFRDAEGNYAVSDAELYRALLPRILTGGQLILESTPWSQAGLLWQLHRECWGKGDAAALVAVCPTALMRDDAKTRRIVEQEQRRDPDNAAREFGACFLEQGAGLFFDAPSLRASADDSIDTLTACPAGWVAYAAADLGLVHDSSSLVVVHRSIVEPQIVRVAEVLELRPRKGAPLDLATVVAEFAAVAQRHGVKVITADHHLIHVANSMASAHGISFSHAPGGAAGKQESHTRARDLFRAGMVRVPASMARLRDQLAQISCTPGSGGQLHIKSPRRGGAHGDVASAAVLALFDAARGGGWAEVDWDWVDSVQRGTPVAFGGAGEAFGAQGPIVGGSYGGGLW